jgi:hypothetical protein
MKTYDFIRSNPISSIIDKWSALGVMLTLGPEIPDELATDELAREIAYAASDREFAWVRRGLIDAWRNKCGNSGPTSCCGAKDGA